MSDHIGLLRYLVDDMNVDIAKWCPLVDAFHYRDVGAIDFIIERSTDEQLRNCILEKDAFGDNLLHVATRNKVSGLSRLIVLILRRKMYDEEKTNALLKSLGVDWTRTSETSSVRASSILNTLNSETNIKRLLLESRRLMGDGISSFTNELNGCGLSAVHIACQDGRVDVLDMLRDIGHADMDLRDAFGRTCSDLVRLMTDAMSEMTRRKVLNYLNDLNDLNEDTTCSSSNMKNADEINNEESEGGWQSSSESTMNWLQDVLDTARHVDVISATKLNRTIFLRDFVSLRRPVLILDAKIGDTTSWTRKSMLERLGDQAVSASIKPYETNHGGNPSTRTRFRNVLQREEQTNMTIMNVKHLPSMLNFQSPPSMFDFPTILRQFYFGSEFTGSHFHYHNNPAINVLVHGLKLWLLVPPEYSIYSTLHPIEEMKDLILSRNLSSFCPHCRVVLQRSSQVVFVPEQWGHLVLNLAECLGMATEFSPVI
eukprot:g475.t1